MTKNIDQDAAEAFSERVGADMSATLVTLMCALGDRLELFKSLVADGPATSEELARRTGTQERYVREWLHCLAAAGYLRYHPSSQTFELPLEHAPALADESGPLFSGGAFQMMLSISGILEPLLGAFQHGGGIPQSAYSNHLWEGMERDTACWVKNALLQEWIPASPDVQAKLQNGCVVADVGCGRGGALIELAQVFPRSQFVGYDAFAPTVERANLSARAAEVEERVRFVCADAAIGLPDHFDVILTFDVIHDAVNPPRLLRGIRSSLRPGGIYVCLDIKGVERPEDRVDAQSAYYYAVSVLYCMTTSLAHQGAGYGTLGLPESRMRSLCRDAGFESVRLLAIDDLWHNLFECRI